jgi:DNA (cytosine-5)-methyltransferase 1
LNNMERKQLSRRNKKTQPIGIDLFAGAGGLSLGFEQAGFNIAYAVEHDKWAAETYKGNRKGVIVDIRDIGQITPLHVLKKLRIKRGELDIIIGGPPCQGFSTSNKKTRTLANPNNHMVYKFVDFTDLLRPKWFLMENVSGMDTFEGGSVRDNLLKLFSGSGYTVDYLILNSADFGVPQSRKRIFFIGNRMGNKMTFLNKLRHCSMESPVTVFDAISDLPRLGNGHAIDLMPYNCRKRKLSSYQATMRKRTNGIVKNNLATRHTDLAVKRFGCIKQGENLISLARKAPELVANYSNIDNCHHWTYLRLPWKKPSVTLINYRKNMLIHPVDDRGLTVREAARLQSFPDNYIFYGFLGSQQQQVANAVPPLMGAAIAKEIVKNIE